MASRIQFEFDVQYTWHTTAVKVFRRIYSNREKFCKALATAIGSSPKQNAYFNWILCPMRFTLISRSWRTDCVSASFLWQEKHAHGVRRWGLRRLRGKIDDISRPHHRLYFAWNPTSSPGRFFLALEESTLGTRLRETRWCCCEMSAVFWGYRRSWKHL